MNEQKRKKIIYSIITQHSGFGFNEIYAEVLKSKHASSMSKPTFQKIIHDLEDEGLIAILRSEDSQKVRITANLNLLNAESLWKQYLEITMQRIEDQFTKLEKTMKSLSIMDRITHVTMWVKMIIFLEWRLTTDPEIKEFSKKYLKRIITLKEKIVILAKKHSIDNYNLISLAGRSMTSEVVNISGNLDILISGKKSEDLRTMLRELLIRLSIKYSDNSKN